MDDRIQELLERARETAATAGEYAGPVSYTHLTLPTIA